MNETSVKWEHFWSFFFHILLRCCWGCCCCLHLMFLDSQDVHDTGYKYNFSANFLKFLKWPNGILRGPRRNWFMKKSRMKVENLIKCTVNYYELNVQTIRTPWGIILHTIQGGSDISGTLSMLNRCIKFFFIFYRFFSAKPSQLFAEA